MSRYLLAKPHRSHERRSSSMFADTCGQPCRGAVANRFSRVSEGSLDTNHPGLRAKLSTTQAFDVKLHTFVFRLDKRSDLVGKHKQSALNLSGG